MKQLSLTCPLDRSMSREKVLAKEAKLTNCREHRRQIIWEEENGNENDQERGVNGVRQRFELGRGTRKLSCLSPIVEFVGGRDSALGTSQSGTVSELITNQLEVSEPRTSQLMTLPSHNTCQSETESHESSSQSGTVSSLNPCQPARVSDKDSNR